MPVKNDPISSTDHNNTRRARKRAQQAAARAKATHSRQSGTTPARDSLTGSQLIDSILEDRAEKRRAEAAAQAEAKAARLETERKFREHQAATAKQSLAITSLTGLARKVAETIIDAFPSAQPYEKDGRLVKRTAAATEIMRGQLTTSEASREGAVKLGIGAAHRALNGAYNKLNGA